VVRGGLEFSSQEVHGGQRGPELQNGCLRALGEALDDFLIACQEWSFSVCLGCVLVAAGGVQLRLRRSQEVRGSPEVQNAGLRALQEAWMTTFCSRPFSVKCGSFLCVYGVSWGGAGGIQLLSRRSQEVRGSPKLQNGGLRALEEAWMTTFCLRRFPVKCGCFLCVWVFWWVQEVSSCVQGGYRRSGEVQRSTTAA